MLIEPHYKRSCCWTNFFGLPIQSFGIIHVIKCNDKMVMTDISLVQSFVKY